METIKLNQLYQIDCLKNKEDYIPCELKMYVMKNNINYIKIEDIEEESEEN